MRKLHLILAVSSSLFAFGCDEAAKQAEPPQTQGLEIHAPGVDVTLDKEHGLHVKAGDTEVDANKEDGVNVNAPGVEVEAKPEKAGDE